MINIFGAFGVIWPSRLKDVGVGSVLFVSFLLVSTVLGLLESPNNYEQIKLRPVCFDIGLSISSSSSLVVATLATI